MPSPNWRERDFLSHKDIQNILCISEGAAYQVMHQLPYIKIGKLYRVSTKAFQQWLKDQERKNAK